MRSVRFHVAVAAMLAVLSFLATAAVEARSRPTDPDAPQVLARERLDAPQTPGEIVVELDRTAHRRIVAAGRGRVQEFPIPGRPAVALRLSAFNLLAPNARFVAVDGSGEHELPVPNLRTFRGSVEGDPDSRVVLTFFDDRIAGFVRTWDAEFVVGPADFNAARADGSRILVRERTEPTGAEPSFSCDVTADPAVGSIASRTPGPRSIPFRESIVPESAWAPATRGAGIDGSTLLQASIAIDATVEFHDHFGSLTATQDYLLNLMAQVSDIFEAEVKVKLEVGYLRIFTGEPDPYTDGSTDTSQLLSDLRTEWTNEQGAVSRTVAHLFSRRNSGGAGVAYVDVLCNDNVGYGVSTLSAQGGGWEKNLVAHEIGHNFSSPHTHCFDPEIDRCANQDGCYQGATESITGTIMSYCGQKTSQFHPRVKDEQIRPAAESAYPSCIDTAGLPGRLNGPGLQLSRPNSCPQATLSNDDGSLNSYFGYSGTAQMAWLKRFTPSCYPFRLTRADVLIGHASTVSPGRPIRVLVFVDPGGGGDPGAATPVYASDTTVQLVGTSSFNEYTLDPPVTIVSGDYYIGFYDLLGDASDTFIASLDYSTEGDAFRTAGSTSPTSFNPHSGGTWMIRAEGGPVSSGSLMLDWSLPCNDVGTPGQDFAIYRGDLGAWSGPASLTCSTGRTTAWLASDAPEGYFLVVPSTSAAEGSYGLDAAGFERAPAPSPCLPQSVGGCP